MKSFCQLSFLTAIYQNLACLNYILVDKLAILLIFLVLNAKSLWPLFVRFSIFWVMQYQPEIGRNQMRVSEYEFNAVQFYPRQVHKSWWA